MPRTILFIFGTRPEAIKLAPLIRHLNRTPQRYSVKVCVTAQHRAMLDQVLDAFAIRPDFDLDLMTPGQTLFESTSRIIAGLGRVFAGAKPDLAIVQGDTTTTFCGALAAFYSRVPVAHVEAGLRTGDLAQPFPEELNRVLTSRIAALHFAPTSRAAENLAREGVSSGVSVTGNTGIDAVLYIRDRLERGELSSSGDFTRPGRKLILITAHRRENFGEGFERICAALRQIADREDVNLVYPVHPNPNVRAAADRLKHPNITLIEPLSYVDFVNVMRRAYLILTDSGGIQEEGPSLAKPILVLREKTERPEAVEAGTVKLVGTDPARIVSETALLLENPGEYERRSRCHNPYGDGHASERIEAALRQWHKPPGLCS
ncbi:MAG TPA: UDP-N-acetylglucosamine 2-epimerase (non-hydrolyzing) [Bryobacteraceae bacterium]|nr:UDP-N-acetylglucosamine 2-epimerase (non-hydrolyzing) [Bryobacteraceae bacterium]